MSAVRRLLQPVETFCRVVYILSEIKVKNAMVNNQDNEVMDNVLRV